MELRFKITFKQSHKVIAEVMGTRAVDERITIGELVAKIIETEQFLERLTGLRVHIEQVDDGKPT